MHTNKIRRERFGNEEPACSDRFVIRDFRLGIVGYSVLQECFDCCMVLAVGRLVEIAVGARGGIQKDLRGKH